MRIILDLPLLSVCTTSFNSAAEVRSHWESLAAALQGIPFEYIVVDNRSIDGTYEAFRQLASGQPNVTVLSKRCSRGKGRRLAAARARASTILCVDVDTLYRPYLRSVVETYFREFRSQGLALQVIYAGLYPKDLWDQVGGTRNLNYGEDLDLWMRISQRGRMRWCPIVIGENRKPPGERDFDDPMSTRYGGLERLLRLGRRELDIFRLQGYRRMDLEATRTANTVNLHVGEMIDHWFGPPVSWTTRAAARRIMRGLDLVLRNGL